MDYIIEFYNRTGLDLPILFFFVSLFVLFFLFRAVLFYFEHLE